MSSYFFLIDPLSLFFLFVIAVVSLPSAVYSIGYMKNQYRSGQIFLGWLLFALFVASMAAVVTVRNAFVFLIAWEVMSLVSYFLVVFDSDHERSVRAGMIYIVMTHLGTAFLVAAFLILYKYSGSFDLAVIKVACLSIPANVKNLLFILFLAGFGTKAGIVPLHIWLPYAHPQAPSHISSLMSGVMIKTAIYGIIRFVIFVLGVEAEWWGTLVLVVAGISCLVGVIYALMEHDLKKLLAYHSVENIGIILLGVGLAMFFLKKGLTYPAVFSLMAGLYHLINHAIFKGLLFLGSGSVYKAAGTRDMEKMGGLIHKMPQTAFCFLVGSMAISALPPLNGFVSEWLTLQAFFIGSLNAQAGSKFFLAMCAAVLALTSGLAAACFVKAFGVTFLALPRSRAVEQAVESGLSMKIGMFFLAFLTLLFGIAAVFIIKALLGVSAAVIGADVTGMSFSFGDLFLSPVRGTGLSAPWLALALLVLTGAGYCFMSLGPKKARVYRTWDCGYYKLDSRNEYTATAFSKPFRIAFSFLLLPYRKTQKIRESFYHVKSFAYETRTTPVFKKYIYEPLLGLVFKTAKSMRRMQPGSIHLYLSYIFVTIMTLILLVKKF